MRRLHLCWNKGKHYESVAGLSYREETVDDDDDYDDDDE